MSFKLVVNCITGIGRKQFGQREMESKTTTICFHKMRHSTMEIWICCFKSLMLPPDTVELGGKISYAEHELCWVKLHKPHTTENYRWVHIWAEFRFYDHPVTIPNSKEKKSRQVKHCWIRIMMRYQNESTGKLQDLHLKKPSKSEQYKCSLSLSLRHIFGRIVLTRFAYKSLESISNEKNSKLRNRIADRQTN